MDFIETYQIDLKDAFGEQFMLEKMKEALKFVTCSDLKRNTLEEDFLFTCGNYGPDCFTCTFNKVPNVKEWKLAGQLGRHQRKCQKQGENALFIKTMMLFKLRKQQFEDFLMENQLVGKTPRNILLVYSRKRHNMNQPFYEAYLKDSEILMQVKKKWANLMDSIRRDQQKGDETPAQSTLAYEIPNQLSNFAGCFAQTALSANSITVPLFGNVISPGVDKENTTQLKFDRVKSKPPEVLQFQPREMMGWTEVFGSLPSQMLNSSVEKQSLREIKDLQPSLFS